MRILVTGFGPFGPHDQNPSEELARTCGERFEILPVSYQKISDWLETLDADSFDVWLMLGVHGGDDGFRIEMLGRNLAGDKPDIDGCTCPDGHVCKGAPETISATLWTERVMADCRHALSNDAGSYLCNFLLYSGLHRFPTKRIGFLHVPRFSVIDSYQQRHDLQVVLDGIRADC